MADTEFSNSQFQNIYPDGIENHYWNHARNNIMFRFLNKLKLSKEPMLEIGGGRGVVTRFLRNRGVDITGVELANVNPVKGTEKFFFAGTDAFALPAEMRKRYSVILLLDVIEHLGDPSAFIANIVYAFPNLKYLLVTVPARQELWTNYDEYNGHYKRYSLTDLRNLSSENIKFSKGEYFDHLLYPVFWIYARFIKKREIKLRAPTGWQIAAHRIMSIVLQADYELLPGNWSGTSCICLFETQPSDLNVSGSKNSH